MLGSVITISKAELHAAWLQLKTRSKRRVRKTLATELERYNGIGPGFDLVRITLATLILFGHCFWIAGETRTATQIATPQVSQSASSRAVKGATNQPVERVHFAPQVFEGQSYFRLMLVPMFFAVSGFLVTGSAFRTNSLRIFLIYRFLRIIPALFTEVSLSALFLGPLLTAFTLRDYFTDVQFWEYFGNIVGRVRFLLPGVFWTNPSTIAVNVNLWTLPPEFYCYLIVAILLAANLLTRRHAFSLIFAAATAWLIMNNVRAIVEGEHISSLSSALVVYYFFAGCLLFHWREYVPYHPVLLFACLLASFLLYSCQALFAAPLFVAYVVIYIGMSAIPRLPLVQTGDYSYGVYLYGFPLAQAIICVVPQLSGHGWLLFGITTAVVLSFAALSWHLVEKPTLALKRAMASASLRSFSSLVGPVRSG
jgi:peptidoglycan/LPS O-acetylase OafA/YrhL